MKIVEHFFTCCFHNLFLFIKLHDRIFLFFLQKGVKQICATYGTGNNEPISYLYMNLDFFLPVLSTLLTLALISLSVVYQIKKKLCSHLFQFVREKNVGKMS